MDSHLNDRVPMRARAPIFGSRNCPPTAPNDATEVDEAFATLEIMQRNNLYLDTTTSRRLLRRADCIIMPVRADYIYALFTLPVLIGISFCVWSMVFNSSTVRNDSLIKGYHFVTKTLMRVHTLIRKRNGLRTRPGLGRPGLLLD